MRQDAEGECKCKNKKRVWLTKDEEEKTRKYFTSEIASKVKKKPSSSRVKNFSMIIRTEIKSRYKTK